MPKAARPNAAPAAFTAVRRVAALQEHPLGCDVTLDLAPRVGPPGDVEGAKLGIEFQVGVRQVIVNPPGQGAPVDTFGIAISEPGNDDGHRRTPHDTSFQQRLG